MPRRKRELELAHEADIELRKQMEVSARELSVCADALHHFADGLPRRMRNDANFLHSLADRIANASSELSNEQLIGPDPSCTRQLGRFGKVALGLAGAAILNLGGGMIQGAGAEVYHDIRAHFGSADASLDKLDMRIDDALAYPLILRATDDDGAEVLKVHAALVEEDAVADVGFTGAMAASIVGITYRQLDYWARTNLVRPSLVDSAESGGRRRYSYQDLLELRIVKSLLDAGLKLESVRRAFEYMRTNDVNIATAQLVISGNDVMITTATELVDFMNSAGRGVLVNVLSLDGVRAGLDASIAVHGEQPPEGTA